MNCTDKRWVSICTDIFRLLKKDVTKGDVHGIEVNIRKAKSTQSRIATVTLGLVTIEMILKPYKVEAQGKTGSDEGANVFIILPFEDNSSHGIRIPAYYSERGREPELTCSVSDAMKSPIHSGTRRVVSDYKSVTKVRPY